MSITRASKAVYSYTEKGTWVVIHRYPSEFNSSIDRTNAESSDVGGGTTVAVTAVSEAVGYVRDRDPSSCGILDRGSLRRPRGVRTTTSPGASSVDPSGDSLFSW